MSDTGILINHRTIDSRTSYQLGREDKEAEMKVFINHLVQAISGQLDLARIPISVLLLSPEARAALTRTRAETLADVKAYCMSGELYNGKLAIYEEISQALEPWGITLD